MAEYFGYFLETTRDRMLAVFLIIALVTFLVVLLSKHSEAQKWMLVASFGVVIYFAANIAPGDNYQIDRKMIYISTMWLGLGAVMGLMAICEVEVHKWIQTVSVVLITILSLAITTINYHDGWDKITEIEDPSSPGGLIKVSGNGWMYYTVNIGLLAVLLVLAIYMVVKISKKKGSKRRELTILLMFLGIPAIVWALAMLMGFSTARSNFVLFAGLDLAILHLQIQYNILTTVPMAKEQIVETSDEGIIILDGRGRFLYANATARSIYPELNNKNEDKITHFVKSNVLCLGQDARIDVGDKHYSLYKEDVMEQSRRVGMTLWLKDITAEVDYSNMMEKRSETDLMTSLMNRGGGENRIAGLLSEGRAGLFCLLDADHFKSFNDTFGHAVGDAVIKAIADALRTGLEGTEATIMRLGGDEFAFFVPNTADEETGEKIVQKIFDKISEVRIEGTDGRKVTLSFGAVIYDGAKPVTFDDIYHAADTGTYTSKQHEGNYVSFVNL